MDGQRLFRGGGAVAGCAMALVACNAPGSEPQPAPPVSPAAQVSEREVRWPGEGEIDRGALESLGPRAAETVRASQVPVLLPGRKEWLAEAIVLTKPAWTTASIAIDGATIVVTATRVKHKVPGVTAAEGNRALRSAKGFVSQNEGIWSASWIENGVAYSAEVECAQAGDARCADDAFVTKVANELVYVGGNGAGAPAAKGAP